MHYGGYPCRMEEISALCRRYGVALIEDACHAVGARYQGFQEKAPQGKMAGTIGDLGCFSFFSNKNLAIGEGGMVVTNSGELAKRVRLLRSHGMSSLTWDRHRGHASSYDVLTHGYNYRLDEIRAALGRVQLQKLERNNAWRRELVKLYRERLGALEDWTIPFSEYGGDSAYHLMVAVAPNQEERTRVATLLREAQIQTSMHYPLVPAFAAFRDGRAPASATPDAVTDLDQSIAFAQHALTLPLSSSMTVRQVEEVSAVMLEQVEVAR